MSVALIGEGGDHSCFLKGAPELVLAGCQEAMCDGKAVPIETCTGEIRSALAKATGEKGLRVIGFSQRLPGGAECRADGQDACLQCTKRTFVGLVGIADPLRPEVVESVRICRDAGIKVKMVTGDDLQTAMSIGRESGILLSDAAAMNSSELQTISDADFPAVAASVQVLARSRPVDKLRLVQELRRQGEVVAVTGDGTNDAPALKAADVGLSMGLSGSEVAKEASDIVLVDDNFRSIVTAVRWGRALYENIQRFLQFQLSVNVVALLCAFLGPLVGVPLPMTVPQLLWINIIMDTFAALALSTEPPRPSTMHRPPVRRGTHILTRPMMIGIGICSLYQVAVLMTILVLSPLGGETEIEKLSIFFTTFVMFQFWHKFNCRALTPQDSPFKLLSKNPNFLVIVATITVVQVIMVQVGGPIGQLFRTVPLDLRTWGIILALTATILPVAWIGRIVASKTGNVTAGAATT